MSIDITFNFNQDSGGKDPDLHSKTLKKYHQLLWSKQLPNGELMQLESSNKYLSYRFNMQTLNFGSDSISNSFIGTKRISHLMEKLPKFEIEEFRYLGSTIGGYLIFPSERERGRMTINGARGFNSKIADRFDLTLECIRLHYLKLENPLSGTFNTSINKFFFSLFGNFHNYVDFFFLQDLVDTNFERINFFTKIDTPFLKSPIPDSAEEYLEYKKTSLRFVQLRNWRIQEWAQQQDMGEET